jgi:serine/threonine protein kinase
VTLESGRRLGPYQVLSALGAGGMGEVYRARDTRLGREVALKVLPPDVAGDPARRSRLEREARAVAAFNHPGILGIHDVGEDEGLALIVTELLEGETLRERLRRGPVAFERVAQWGGSAAEALAVAHARGIVHRDLKPENLFLTRDGRLKVLDFGLAKELLVAAGGDEDPTLASPTRAGVVLGTLGYLSPEQARGEAVDGRSDIFSLGCVLYEALCGKRAFGGQTAQGIDRRRAEGRARGFSHAAPRRPGLARDAAAPRDRRARPALLVPRRPAARLRGGERERLPGVVAGGRPDRLRGKRDVARLPPFTTLQGIAWSADDRRLVYGLVQHESRILLFDGLDLF